MKITKKDITYLVVKVLKEMEGGNSALPDGVYIQLRSGDIVTEDEYKQMGKQRTRGVLVKSDGHAFVILKHDAEEGLMTWGEAVSQYDIWSREEAQQVGKYRKEINAALILIGGEPIKDDWYWTSTEFSSYTSWGYSGTYGYLSVSSKIISYGVRPFAAFSLRY